MGAFEQPLDAKKERECFERIKDKSRSKEKDFQEAREMLILHNMRLVDHIARPFSFKLADLEDFRSLGTIGLIKAIDTFNIDKEAKFSTYATRCIQNEICMHLRKHKNTDKDISMDAEIFTDKDGNAQTLGETIESGINIEDDVLNRLCCEDAIEYINKNFKDREVEIITMRFGLGGTKRCTQIEIAEKLKISRSYVSRIESRLKKDLADKYNYKG